MALLAAVSFYAAANQMADAFTAGPQHWGQEVKVSRIYLTQADYADYLSTLARLNPGVRFTMNRENNAIVLSIADEQLFPDFMMSLSTLQAFRPSVAWDLVELCAKKCPDDAVAMAVVQGFTQEIR